MNPEDMPTGEGSDLPFLNWFVGSGQVHLPPQGLMGSLVVHMAHMPESPWGTGKYIIRKVCLVI